MIPKPKSEAWVICALKPGPYRDCVPLEDRSGNDNAPNSRKGELAESLDGLPIRRELCDMVNDGSIDINRIDMPSAVAFREALLKALQS